jgi:hypothetical protein
LTLFDFSGVYQKVNDELENPSTRTSSGIAESLTVA